MSFLIGCKVTDNIWNNQGFLWIFFYTYYIIRRITLIVNNT